MKLKHCVRIVFSLMTLLLINSLTYASFLEDEAGISAYSTVSSVDLAAAATAYKNIEYQTGEYIVGSVALPNYKEIDDVHVYLHISGEIIAYYLRDTNVGHMIDWIAYHNTKKMMGSKLQTALEIVSSAMLASLTEVKYFDFRYPDAPRIKIIIDNVYSGTDTFRFKVPESYTIHSVSWSHAVIDPGTSGTANSTFKLDDVGINSMSSISHDVWGICHGDFSSVQVAPDVYHEVSISADYNDYAYVAIIILYTEP